MEKFEKRRQEEKEQVEKQRRMQEHQTRGSRDDFGHMNVSSEEAEDDELDWLTELSAIKPKCAGCSFLAKQLYKIQKELKKLNEKQHRRKVNTTEFSCSPLSPHPLHKSLPKCPENKI